jgi:hypothetical protein
VDVVLFVCVVCLCVCVFVCVWGGGGEARWATGGGGIVQQACELPGHSPDVCYAAAAGLGGPKWLHALCAASLHQHWLRLFAGRTHTLLAPLLLAH